MALTFKIALPVYNLLDASTLRPWLNLIAAEIYPYLFSLTMLQKAHVFLKLSLQRHTSFWAVAAKKA